MINQMNSHLPPGVTTPSAEQQDSYPSLPFPPSPLPPLRRLPSPVCRVGLAAGGVGVWAGGVVGVFTALRPVRGGCLGLQSSQKRSKALSTVLVNGLPQSSHRTCLGGGVCFLIALSFLLRWEAFRFLPHWLDLFRASPYPESEDVAGQLFVQPHPHFQRDINMVVVTS